MESNEFRVFGLSHIYAFVTLYTTVLILILVEPRLWSQKVKNKFYTILGCILVFTLPIQQLYFIIRNVWDYHFHLPLHISNLIIIMMCLAFLRSERIWTTFALFWGIPAGVGSSILPDIRQDFPNIYYFSFWAIHGLMVVSIYFLLLKRNYPLRYRDLWIAFLTLFAYITLITPLNHFLGTNYAYSINAPSTLKFLNDTSWLGVQVGFAFLISPLVLILFHIVYWIAKIFTRNQMINNQIEFN